MSAKQKQAEMNIQTFLRIRPSKKPSGYINPDDLDPNSIAVNLPENFRSDYIDNSKLNHSFHFNGVLPMNATQDDVFKAVGVPAVHNSFEGFNSTIFAYGQTGSGKTFTLTGGPEKYSDRGLIPRCIHMIFNEVRTRGDMHFKMYVSYLEIYNEQGFDLLDPSHETRGLEELPKVRMLEDEHGNFHLKNLSMHPADNEEDALNLLFMGDTNRAIAETPMNMASSRSHCIFSIAMEAREAGSDRIRRSKLNLVDLAGSERIGKTNSSGTVLKEAKYINSSLFYLEVVINALYEKATIGRAHIPYRNSMMTSVLRDSLGGNCKTIMVATVNPEAAHTDESLSTCRFAQRVSLIKNKASVNEDLDPSQVIKRLKSEILALREEVAFLKGESGEGEVLTPQEVEDLKRQCREYCEDPDPYCTLNIGQMTLSKIKDAFAVLKNLVIEARASAPSSSASSQMEEKSGLADEAAQKQIKELRSCLLQRDQEIAILVNMVKAGKTVGDVSSSMSRGSDRADEASFVEAPGSQADRRAAGVRGGESKEELMMMERASKEARMKQFAKQQQRDRELEQQREREREDKILKRHLFGVPPPSDKAIFDDSAMSFEWFRERCSLNASMEENRDILKQKINDAKIAGERANQSRNTITYLKNSIESIRRERAIHTMGEGKEADDAGEESPEEQAHRRAIEQEKLVYKESFDQLRILKPEIEHIKKMLEKCRSSMQQQFDQWYSNLHARSDLLNLGREREREAEMAERSTNNYNYTSSSASPQQPAQRAPVSAPISDMAPAPAPVLIAPRGREQAFPSAVLRAPVASQSPRGGAAAGERRQKQDEEDDVNEDIALFYQAKEEMLKRRAANR